jgi:hypothetical protein
MVENVKRVSKKIGEGRRWIVRARTLGSPLVADGEQGMAAGRAWPAGVATGPAPAGPTGSVRARHPWAEPAALGEAAC